MIILSTRSIIWLLAIFNNLILTFTNILTMKNSENDVSKALANIVQSCQINDFSTMFITEHFTHNDIQMLDIKPKIMRNNLEIPKELIENTIELLIISTDSIDNFTKFLMQISQSLILKRLKYSIILNKSPTNNNCDDHFDYLYIALQYDMINTIFLCMTSSKKIMVYTCNPYASWAPPPWKIDIQHWNYTQEYIYTAQYIPNTVTCEDLFFDKTRRINGYKGIRAVTYIPRAFVHKNIAYNRDKCPKKGFDFRIIEFLYSQLGVPLSYKVGFEYGAFDEFGIPCGVDEFVVEKKFDLLIDSRALAYTNDSVESSSILGETGVTFVSHQRGNVSTIMRIINYFRPIIMFFSLIVLGITIIILKISINESFSIAVIEVFRLFFNGPLLKVPNRQSPRIYIFTILIFILVMQTILRTKILSFIMVPESNNFETFAELASHKEYTVYCKHGFDHLLPSEIRKRCRVMKFYQNFVNRTKGVLVWDKYSNIGIAHEYKMHASREVISKHHISFRMRKNWPLAKRVNAIFARMFESGLNHYHLKAAEHFVELKNHQSLQQKLKNSRTLNLQDLDFAFQTFVFGIILAFIMFSIEIKSWEYIQHYYNRLLRFLKRRKH